MDELGKGFDQRVLEWKADAESSMNAMVIKYYDHA